ncbi:hypothetical protein CSQ89_11380 [Chitinimonas sp. BJB300]|nr:hypothetical protein CSQ89_11380 [Chitinimonas sp. BJB300]TSJ87580.1 nucleotidyltransferase family protein [Chitinimonas sp. BJB300]
MIYASPWLMQALYAARELNLSEWCIGAGAVRNLVWDVAHGWEPLPHQHSDIDLCYFNAGDIRPERDTALQIMLQQKLPAFKWEVVNQAGVHSWFADYFGYAIPPFTNLSAAVASWPETATAVAVWLDENDGLHIIAPHGLTDLFDLWVRPSPGCNPAAYRARVEAKQYALRWPKVRQVPV